MLLESKSGQNIRMAPVLQRTEVLKDGRDGKWQAAPTTRNPVAVGRELLSQKTK